VYRIVWEYEVRPEAVAEFERVYGADGQWVEFFKRSPAYVETELYKSANTKARFITVDVWRDRPTYEQFRKAFANDYAALDNACDKFLKHERTLGVMDDGKSS
jgi:heme-degrading monooxygenase HmoA